MEMQNAIKLNITEGDVRTIHDKDSNLLWGKLWYNARYAGDTYQPTYVGKNLFLCPSLSNSTDMTRTRLGDNTFMVETNSTGANQFTTLTISLSPNTEYTFSFDRKIIGTSSTNSGTVRPQIEGTYGSYYSGTFQFTTGESGTVKFLFYNFSSNTAGNTIKNSVTWSNIQIELGTVATSYEPYTGLHPSPSTEWPQAVQNVSGVQTISITGKNLFDKNNPNLCAGYFNASGVINGADITDLTRTSDRFVYLECEPNTTYTITRPLQTTQSLRRFRVGTLEKINAIAGSQLSDFWRMTDGGSTTEHTITTGPNAHYLFIYFAKASSATDPGGEIQPLLDGMQVEKNAEATEYESFQGYKYTISLDGNLFNSKAPNMIPNGYDNAGSIAIGTGNANYIFWIPCKPNTAYSLKLPVASSNPPIEYKKIFTTEQAPASGVSVSQLTEAIAKDVDKYENFVTNGNARFLCVRIRGTNIVTTQTGYELVLLSLQIKEGATLDEFTPINLCKIGNNQDYILKRSGKWLLHKETREIASYNGESVQGAFFSNTGQLSIGANVFVADTIQTETAIDNQFLVSQLDSVHQWMTRYGYNAVTSGDLPIIIDKTVL